MRSRQQKIAAHIFNLTGICPSARQILSKAQELHRETKQRIRLCAIVTLIGWLEDEAHSLLNAHKGDTQHIEACDALCLSAWHFRLAFCLKDPLDGDLHQAIAALKGAVVAARRRDVMHHETPVLMAYLSARFEERHREGGEDYCDARR